jgi:hypothetical protein
MHVAIPLWVVPSSAIVLIWLLAIFWPVSARQTTYDFMHGMIVIARLVGAVILTLLVCFAYACAVLFLRSS